MVNALLKVVVILVLVGGCATPRAAAPAALDPSNPDAPEGPSLATAAKPSMRVAPPREVATTGEGGGETAGHHAAGGGAASASEGGDATVYTCPMHPEVRSDKPGECPKCGMDLVPATSGTRSSGQTQPGAAGTAETPHGDEGHAAGGEAVGSTPPRNPGEAAAAAKRPEQIYSCPMHPEVRSNEPGRCPKCKMKLVPEKAKQPQQQGIGQQQGAGQQHQGHGQQQEPAGHQHGTSSGKGGQASPSGQPANAAAKQPAAQVYTCPMHPEVRSDKPGKCPKCGMTLVPEKKEAAPKADDHEQHGGSR